MDIRWLTYDLYKRLPSKDLDYVLWCRMTIDPNTGEFRIIKKEGNDAEFIKLKISTDIALDQYIKEHNYKEYNNCVDELNKYVLHKNSDQYRHSDKVDRRIQFLNEVKSRFVDWFVNNDIAIKKEDSLVKIARKNNLNIDNIDLSKASKRMIKAIEILYLSNDEPIAGLELLIKIDEVLEAKTEYNKVSEIFKPNRDLFGVFVEIVQKGKYRIKKN